MDLVKELDNVATADNVIARRASTQMPAARTDIWLLRIGSVCGLGGVSSLRRMPAWRSEL